MSPPRFYRLFGSLEGLCEKAGIKLDRETKERIKGTRKATRRRVKKKRIIHRDSNPAVTVESVKQPTASIYEEIQRDLDTESEARENRLMNVGRFAGEIQTLALSADAQISEPVLDALHNVLPAVLKQKYGVEATLKDLLGSQEFLRQVQKREKKLREKEFQLDGLGQKLEQKEQRIQTEWENIKKERKRDPGKAALQVRVNELEQNEKVLQDMLNEVYVRDKNFRLIATTFLFSISQCEKCRTLAINSLKLHPQVLEWFLERKWMTLSFDTLDASKLLSQT